MIPPSPPMSCYSQGISAYLFSTTFNKKKTFEGLIRSKKWKNQFFPIFSPTIWYALASPQFCYLSEVDFLHSVGLIVTLDTILWNVGGGWWVRVMISGDPDVYCPSLWNRLWVRHCPPSLTLCREGPGGRHCSPLALFFWEGPGGYRVIQLKCSELLSLYGEISGSIGSVHSLNCCPNYDVYLNTFK